MTGSKRYRQRRYKHLPEGSKPQPADGRTKRVPSATRQAAGHPPKSSARRQPPDPQQPATDRFALGLGQRTRVVKGVRISDARRPLTRAELEAQLSGAAHGTCVEHVAIAGYREPVCIGKGQDRERIIADAIDLLP